ncbi:hypothetical protein BU16DRAFT_528226 [Lophium mytilinum]|uniref:DH domain-containing protein n=1 Tax=Lophium mytilinum TaxID=390894 RepID=A0A6A6QPJ7_9PEZI|nr:hypothetical protein BU16DRAFT_528226 [Lophium mytilinum]
MAYVLSLRPQSPLKRSFSETPYLRSYSTLQEDTQLAAFPQLSSRISVGSLKSFVSVQASPRPHSNENTPPKRKSRFNATKAAPTELSLSYNIRQPDVVAELHRSSSSTYIGSPEFSLDQGNTLDCDLDSLKKENDSVRHDENSPGLVDSRSESDICSFYDALLIPLPDSRSSDSTESYETVEEPAQIVIEISPPPFMRWISTLRKKHAVKGTTYRSDWRSSGDDDTGDDLDSALWLMPHIIESPRKDSGSVSSSLGFVTAIKSASITLASVSIATCSHGGLHKIKSRGTRSSGLSEARNSIDSSSAALGPIMDEGTWFRSVQRRKILEELIASEEGYIGDIKILVNEYFMILAAVPGLPAHIRMAIQQNVTQILQLHEDILGELHKVIPHAEYTHTARHASYPVTKAKHIRFHSADVIPGRFHETRRPSHKTRRSLDNGATPDHRPRGLVTDTQTAANVAKIFNKHMNRFFAYEEYGAHWTAMSQELTSTCKNLPSWHAYERGVEALSKTLTSENNREANSRKALSFSDLLIKPIQRVCKYPLLFSDLCRYTPVYDDPEAHAELQRAVFRLHEAIREVNKAKDDPRRRRLIEATWQLQDRLAFPEENTISRTAVFRLLGHVLLCGVLHVAYQSPERPKGQYMICVLYKTCLILATTDPSSYKIYNVVAAISLANGSIEPPSNGRGLQCHTAQHTWKLVFEQDHRIFDVILSACTAREEETWKHNLQERISAETHDLTEESPATRDTYSSLCLDIRSIGPVFGSEENLRRRMSVHRAATMGPKCNSNQVIIQGTQAQKIQEPSQSTVSLPVARSKSHLSSHFIPTLAPRRGERTRLETVIEDVWTKDLLPFPGMAPRRAENPLRASANSVMRKLSMASIASNFSRRSPSFTSLSHTRSEESFSGLPGPPGGMRAKSALSVRRPAPALVDFHNAPAAFLPTDFELQDKTASRQRRFGHKTTLAYRSSYRSAKKARRDSATQIPMFPQRPVLPDRVGYSNCSDDTIIHKRPQGNPNNILENEIPRCKSAQSAPPTRAPSMASTTAPKKPSRVKSTLHRFFKG